MAEQKVSPLFKYIGGKSWLKNYLSSELKKMFEANPRIDTYVEPFAGGLGAFLSVSNILLEHGVKNVILNDINSKLIGFYENVYKNHDALINGYVVLENEYAKTIPVDFHKYDKKKDKEQIKLALEGAVQFFYRIRSLFNQETDPLKNSIYLLFLQTHCFNGIYRENSNGGYNTPFNWDSRIVSEDKIRDKIMSVVDLFDKFEITFSNKSYADLDYSLNAVYYLDPPYINEENLVENKYHKESFGLESQRDLIKKVEYSNFIYSNHDNTVLIDEFEKLSIEFNVQKIARKNIISASNESRKTDKMEILVSSKIKQL